MSQQSNELLSIKQHHYQLKNIFFDDICKFCKKSIFDILHGKHDSLADFKKAFLKKLRQFRKEGYFNRAKILIYTMEDTAENREKIKNYILSWQRALTDFFRRYQNQEKAKSLAFTLLSIWFDKDLLDRHQIKQEDAKITVDKLVINIINEFTQYPKQLTSNARETLNALKRKPDDLDHNTRKLLQNLSLALDSEERLLAQAKKISENSIKIRNELLVTFDMPVIKS